MGVITLSLGVIEKPVWCDHFSCFFLMMQEEGNGNEYMAKSLQKIAENKSYLLKLFPNEM